MKWQRAQKRKKGGGESGSFEVTLDFLFPFLSFSFSFSPCSV